jgi:hypothetical protein
MPGPLNSPSQSPIRASRWRAAHACAAQVLSGLVCLSAQNLSHAQVYSAAPSSDNGDEVIVLSNFRSDDTPWLLVDGPAPHPAAANSPTGTQALQPVKSPPPAKSLPLPVSSPELQRVINDVAKQLQIEPALLHAVIATESRYDVRAVSSKGAIGLMQLLPATARRFGVTDAFLPRDNVFAGASYLKWLMVLFDNDLELVLAAYNAGENAVLKAGRRIPPYAETQAYVPRVMAYFRCASDATCRRA